MTQKTLSSRSFLLALLPLLLILVSCAAAAPAAAPSESRQAQSEELTVYSGVEPSIFSGTSLIQYACFADDTPADQQLEFLKQYGVDPRPEAMIGLELPSVQENSSLFSTLKAGNRGYARFTYEEALAALTANPDNSLLAQLVASCANVVSLCEKCECLPPMATPYAPTE